MRRLALVVLASFSPGLAPAQTPTAEELLAAMDEVLQFDTRTSTATMEVIDARRTRSYRMTSYARGQDDAAVLYLEPAGENLLFHQSMSNRHTDEVAILLPSGSVLRQDQVVDLQAQPHRPLGRQLDEPVFPASGKSCCLRPNAVGEVAVCFVEGRELADGSVDQIGPLRMIPGVDIRLHRLQQLRTGRWKLPEQCLAPDNHDLPRACDSSRRANHVCELLPCHEAIRSRTSRQIRRRVC